MGREGNFGDVCKAEEEDGETKGKGNGEGKQGIGKKS